MLFCGGRFAVLLRSVRGIASVIRTSQVAPPRLGVVECCFASVIRASQVAPLRLRRLTVVWRRLVRGVARRGAIYDARCRNGTIGRPRWASAYVACCGRFVVLYWPVRGFAVVIRASRVAPVRLGAVDCCLASAGSRRSRRGAIYDARCRNGTIRRPCGFFEPFGKGGLHSGGCPKILCFQIVVPHVCITFAA